MGELAINEAFQEDHPGRGHAGNAGGTVRLSDSTNREEASRAQVK